MRIAPTRTSGRSPRRRWRLALAASGLVGFAGISAAVIVHSGWWLTPIQRAARALDAGKLPEAGAILNRIIADEPRQPEARLLYARLLRLSGLRREADAALGKAMDLGVAEASLWREYGLLLADPDFRKAEPILLRAVQARPGDVEVLRALADGLSRQGRWPEAAERYAEVLRVEPDQRAALLGRSRALVQSGRSPAAVAELRHLLRLRPNDYEVRLLLANSFLSDAAIDQAVPELERCHQLRPDRPEPLAALASCAIERADPDRARSLLDQAIALDPRSVLALTGRGNLAMNRSEYDQARADFERVVALDPSNKQGHLHLAQLFRRSGNRAKAEEHEQAYRRLQTEQEAEFRTVRGMQ